MLQRSDIVIGQGARETDVYVHFCDVQDQVCNHWKWGEFTGWSGTATALWDLEDLLRLALDDSDHPLLNDLHFLAGLAIERASMEREVTQAARRTRMQSCA